MSALDKINDLIVRIQSGDEEFIAIFEEGFKKFEEEYDKEAMMIQVEEMVGRMSDTSKEILQMKQSKDGKINLRKITNEKRQADGKLPITEQIDSNIDYLPIDRMVEIIKDKVLRSAHDGSNTAYADFILIYQNDVTERQEYSLLNVLYDRLSEIFTDTLELDISWAEDYVTEESFMVIAIEW
jgi:hypothetical protein